MRGPVAGPGTGAVTAFEEARLIARSRSRLAAALSLSAALLVAGCYSKIPEEDGGSMPASEAAKPPMTPLEREQAAALAEQKKRVAALAETGAGADEKKAAGGGQKTVASADLKPEPRRAPSDPERATAASAVAPGAGGYWVQVGSGRDEKDSVALWHQLKAAHPSILGDASHAIVRADLGPGKGVFYRVHVGPYDSANAAGAVCGRLRAARADCFLIGPAGAIITAPEPRSASVDATRPADGHPTQATPAPAKTTARPPPTAPNETKPTEAKPAETKPAETKPTETKPAETKPAETKPAAVAREAKPAATPEPPAKAGAETEAKKAEPKSPETKSDVPFRTMGLPGLPD